jgi:hypothetical protein
MTSLPLYWDVVMLTGDQNSTQRVCKGKTRRGLSTNNSDLVELQVLDKQQQNKVMIIIRDKDLCLSVEVKDNDDEDYGSSVELLGLATYSNSESTVSSYASIFEILWLQAELNNKKKNISTVT